MPNAVNESLLFLGTSLLRLFPCPLQCPTLSNPLQHTHTISPLAAHPDLPSFIIALHQGHHKAHYMAQTHQQRASLHGGAWGNLEADVLAPGLHVEAEELFQGGRLDDLEALLAAEGRGLPVPGATDGIGQQTLHTPRTAHIDHAEGGDRGAGALCYET